MRLEEEDDEGVVRLDVARGCEGVVLRLPPSIFAIWAATLASVPGVIATPL